MTDEDRRAISEMLTEIDRNTTAIYGTTTAIYGTTMKMRRILDRIRSERFADSLAGHVAGSLAEKPADRRDDDPTSEASMRKLEASLTEATRRLNLIPDLISRLEALEAVDTAAPTDTVAIRAGELKVRLDALETRIASLETAVLTRLADPSA